MGAKPVARVALVVEDEWIVRDDIVSELKAQGWTVVEAATGEEALLLLAAREVHVLLTDIQLAGSHERMGSCSCRTRGQARASGHLCLRQHAGPVAAGRWKPVLPQALRSCGRRCRLPPAHRCRVMLKFPNASRSYDPTRHCVRFWGHDGALEIRSLWRRMLYCS